MSNTKKQNETIWKHLVDLCVQGHNVAVSVSLIYISVTLI